MSERDEFDVLVSKYAECPAVFDGGCACLGRCLGHQLGKLRKKYDKDHEGAGHWWSDQLHGALLTRPGDSGRTGAPLTAGNYWTGAQ